MLVAWSPPADLGQHDGAAVRFNEIITTWRWSTAARGQIQDGNGEYSGRSRAFSTNGPRTARLSVSVRQGWSEDTEYEVRMRVESFAVLARGRRPTGRTLR